MKNQINEVTRESKGKNETTAYSLSGNTKILNYGPVC